MVYTRMPNSQVSSLVRMSVPDFMHCFPQIAFDVSRARFSPSAGQKQLDLPVKDPHS